VKHICCSNNDVTLFASKINVDDIVCLWNLEARAGRIYSKFTVENNFV